MIFLAILFVTSVRAHGGLVDGLYCGEENCYDVLGVSPESTDREIKKAYKGFAKDLHPDRFTKQNLNKEEKLEIEDRFRRIATAYETLKGSEREEYDDFLANPEKYYYQYYQYYRRKWVSPTIDLRLVFFVLSLAISALQWIGWNTNYKNAIEYMYHVDKYRLAAKREAEDRNLIGNKKSKQRENANGNQTGGKEMYYGNYRRKG